MVFQDHTGIRMTVVQQAVPYDASYAIRHVPYPCHVYMDVILIWRIRHVSSCDCGAVIIDFDAIRATGSYIRVCDTVYTGCNQNIWWTAPPYEMNSYGISNIHWKFSCAVNADCFVTCHRQICTVYHTDHITDHDTGASVWNEFTRIFADAPSPNIPAPFACMVWNYVRWRKCVLHRHLPPHPDEAPFVCILTVSVPRQAGSCHLHICRPCEAV